MTTETISVPEISCGHCKTAIEEALTPLPGVERAEVDVAARTVTVDYDDDRVSRSQLVSEIVDVGYEVPA